MTRIDSFLGTFVARGKKMKQLPDFLSSESFPAQSELAVRILVHAKSIPEKVQVTHVSSAFRAGPSSATDSSYEAMIVNSTCPRNPLRSTASAICANVVDDAMPVSSTMQIDIEAARLRQREQPVEAACQNGGILFFSETERESSQPSTGCRPALRSRRRRKARG
jgi:hypothetical protein